MKSMRSLMFLIFGITSMLLSCGGDATNKEQADEENSLVNKSIPTTLYSVKALGSIKTLDTLAWNYLCDFSSLIKYHPEVISIDIDTNIIDSIGTSRIITLKQGGTLTEKAISWSKLDSMSFIVTPTPIDSNPTLIDWNFNKLIHSFAIQAQDDSTLITITTTWDYLKEESMHPEHIEIDKKQFITINNSMIAGLKKMLEKKVKKRYVRRKPVVIDTVVIADTAFYNN